MWNPHYWQNINAGPLEEFFESYELIVNNDTDSLICSSSPRISIINLAFSSPELEPLRVYEILEEYPSLSDYKLMLME